jgi:hypothetical protein
VLFAGAQNNDGRLEVLYPNSNAQIMHCYQSPNGTSTGSQNFFGATARQLTLTKDKLGRVTLNVQPALEVAVKYCGLRHLRCSTLPILALLFATLAGTARRRRPPARPRQRQPPALPPPPPPRPC